MKYRHVFIIVLITIIYSVIIGVVVSIPNSIVQTSNDWISFYGGIGGGILTLIGVSISVNYSKAQSKIDFENMNYPILNFRKRELEDDDDYNYPFVFSDIGMSQKERDSLMSEKCGLFLENVGNGVALDICFETPFDGVELAIGEIIHAVGSGHNFKIVLCVSFIKTPEDKLKFNIPYTFKDLAGNRFKQEIVVVYSAQKNCISYLYTEKQERIKV